MEPLTAVGIILAIFLVLAALIAHYDGLAFLAPKSTRGIAGAATNFCLDRCRVQGRCPLTGATEPAGNCPLWGFIQADVPTVVYGSPFERSAT